MKGPAPGKPRGLVKRRAPVNRTHHERFAPAAALAPFIAHFWTVRWDFRGHPPFEVQTLPHPCVHIIFEADRARVGGVPTRIFTRRLEGQGRVFGIKFRPAAFQPWWRGPVSAITDRTVSLRATFGARSDALRDAIRAEQDPQICSSLAEEFLLPRIPPMPPAIAHLRDLVERLATESSINRVEQAAGLAGMDLRTLQRRFKSAVGVSPKWVIQRYRLHEALEQLSSEKGPDLASLALRLGYFDQSHFIRDFKAMIGRAPSKYAAAE